MTTTSSNRRSKAIVALLAFLGALLLPVTRAEADVNVYTTPGYHTVNGRQWHTVCEPYTVDITRCRADIWATQVSRVNGRYVTSTKWVFNNLTYLEAPRALWTGNPLATPGEHLVSGRKWKTECDTSWTGKNACRSFIWATVIEAVKTSSGTSYRTVNKWVFNNIVLFTPDGTTLPPATVCNGAVLPDGFAISNGRPHATKTPYPDKTLYNPTSISNFIRLVIADSRTSASDKSCLAKFGGDALLAGAIKKPTPSGASALWFPYMFEFSANPAIPALKPGWISGLAQGGSLGALSMLYEFTGDSKWLTSAEQTFESFTVPLSQGGFTHEVNGALWFEEYPTAPPTTVLNGNMEAIIALDLWQRRSNDPRATDLFKRSVAGLKKILPAEQVPVLQGIMTTYDQVRGYPSAPIRLATGSSLKVTDARQNFPTGTRILDLPVAGPASDGANLVENSSMSTWASGVPTGWYRAIGTASGFSNAGGAVAITSNGSSWQTLAQRVPASKLKPNTNYRLSWRGKTAYPALVDGTSGRVVALSSCGGTVAVIGEHNITRSREFSIHDMLVRSPAAGCDIIIQLYQADWRVTSTTVTFDDVTLVPAQPGTGATLVWPLMVQDAPSSTVSITYTGTGELQAYDQGRWWSIGKLSSSTPSTTTLTVPQRYTGRNLHYGYHETHVDELVSLYRRTADPEILAYAQAWRPLAPTKEHLFANLSTFPYQGASAAKTTKALAEPVDALDLERIARDSDPDLQPGMLEIGVPQPVNPVGTGIPFE